MGCYQSCLHTLDWIENKIRPFCLWNYLSDQLATFRLSCRFLSSLILSQKLNKYNPFFILTQNLSRIPIKVPLWSGLTDINQYKIHIQTIPLATSPSVSSVFVLCICFGPYEFSVPFNSIQKLIFFFRFSRFARSLPTLVKRIFRCTCHSQCACIRRSHIIRIVRI